MVADIVLHKKKKKKKKKRIQIVAKNNTNEILLVPKNFGIIMAVNWNSKKYTQCSNYPNHSLNRSINPISATDNPQTIFYLKKKIPKIILIF
jgi:hypothetical protein